MSLACIIIASHNRQQLLDDLILPSAQAQWFDEVVVVGDYHSGDGYRHLPFPPLTNSTVDALFKRDVGTVATESDWLFYLCDDHRIHPDFSPDLAQLVQETSFGPKDVIVPARFCIRDGEKVVLNMGSPDYCGGHGGIFPRMAIREIPWSVAPWHPNWDYLHSQMLTDRGYQFHHQETALWIEDIDPNGEPWR